MKLLKAEAGVNDGKAGLLSAAGLFAKGGIFDKKSESFNIQELNPYLLFDSRESMLGTLENPTLDLDPATPSTLDVITATRAGIATYTDSSGLIKAAPIDTVRVDHVDGVPMILVEPSATNLLTNSNSNGLNFAFDNVSMTYNVTGSPDGETNGILLNQTGNSFTNSAYNYGLPTTDGIYSYSIFVKAADSSSIRFRSDNGTVLVQDFNPQTMTQGTSAGGLNLKFEDYGNGWFRVSFTRTLSSAPYNRFQIYPDRNNTQQGVYIFGLQVESGSTVATSYIPTSGSTVTRAADDLAITGSAFTNFFNSGGDGTFYAEFVPKEIETINNIITGHGGGGGGLYLYSNWPTYANVRSYDGTLATSYGDATNNEINRASVSYNSSTFKGSLNGSSEDSTSHNGTFSAQTSLQLGYNVVSPISFKRVIYWPYSSENL